MTSVANIFHSKMCIVLVVHGSPCWNCRMCSFAAAGCSSPLRCEPTNPAGLLHCAHGMLELMSASPECLEGAVKSKCRRKWMTGLGAPCPWELLKERFRPRQAAGPRRALTHLAAELEGLEWGVPEAPWAQCPWDRAKNSFPLQGEEMLFLPLSSTLLSSGRSS